MNIKLMW